MSFLWVVPNSCITCFHLTTLTENFDILHSYRRKAYEKTHPILPVKGTVLRISIDFLIRKIILYIKYMDFNTTHHSLS